MSIWPGTHSLGDRDGNANRGSFPRASSRLVRNRSIRSAVALGLRPCKRSLVPSITISRSVSAGMSGAASGSSRPLAPQLPNTHPVSAARMSTHQLPGAQRPPSRDRGS